VSRAWGKRGPGLKKDTARNGRDRGGGDRKEKLKKGGKLVWFSFDRKKGRREGKQQWGGIASEKGRKKKPTKETIHAKRGNTHFN